MISKHHFVPAFLLASLPALALAATLSPLPPAEISARPLPPAAVSTDCPSLRGTGFGEMFELTCPPARQAQAPARGADAKNVRAGCTVSAVC